MPSLQNGKTQMKVIKFLFNISNYLEDNILKLQTELSDVTNIMKKNLQELLKREESLENLMSKSKDLNSVSLEFYKSAKKANSKCCNLY
jgi:synaptobrevin family protein YKT6